MREYFAGRYYAVSRLGPEHRGVLENLVFFNEGQGRIRQSMVRSIEQYGTPQISERDGWIAVELPSVPQVQVLYILEEEFGRSTLSGVVIYARRESSLDVIYIGLDPRHCFGAGGNNYLFIEIFQLLLAIGRRIGGVKFVTFNQGSRQLRLAAERKDLSRKCQ